MPTSPPLKALQTVLVANRGEIAVRVLRTLKRLGLKTVLVVSSADRDSMGAQMADKTICIGPAHASASYLNINALIHAACALGADAVHPGYGFLAERADFAQACEDHQLHFIGPSAAQIARVGNKLEARQIAALAGVPTTPGGAVQDLAAALALADKIGYPVLIKAVSGGGGRGLKRANTPAELAQRLALAGAEAQAAFGDGRVYIECLVTQGRHIEVQIVGDGVHLIHLGERDCSVQRRYQKVIEEAPAPHLSERMRSELHSAALRFARYLNYRSLGTVEFLLDMTRDCFYFLEMNARIQVEHPVTEQITGLDLVELQIKIAQGEGLTLTQEAVSCQGHAIECRINAEDPAANFKPAPGLVRAATFPQMTGLRIDTHITDQSNIPPFYDALLAKVIASAPTRAAALRLMSSALQQVQITGLATNIALHQRVLHDPVFAQGGVDTGYLERILMHSQEGAQP